MLSNILGGNTMKENSLTLSDKNGVSFTITSTEDRIQAFLKWIAEYKRGNYIATENVVLCNNPADMTACNIKAIQIQCFLSNTTRTKLPTILFILFYFLLRE